MSKYNRGELLNRLDKVIDRAENVLIDLHVASTVSLPLSHYKTSLTFGGFHTLKFDNSRLVLVGASSQLDLVNWDLNQKVEVAKLLPDLHKQALLCTPDFLQDVADTTRLLTNYLDQIAARPAI